MLELGSSAERVVTRSPRQRASSVGGTSRPSPGRLGNGATTAFAFQEKVIEMGISVNKRQLTHVRV
jgi:hypothetical protein